MDAEYEIGVEILRHYEERYDETNRLSSSGFGRLELLRTMELVERFIPDPPARIIDVGGGPGTYAAWLTELGYDVHLVDPVRRHVEQARRRSEAITSVEVGDARSLDHPDDAFDVAMLLGPLYHIVDRAGRLRALREAGRVTKPGGTIIVAAINRFASTIDLLHDGLIDDSEFRRIVEADIGSGVHLNPTDDPRFFTTAYFHRPDELERELADAGLTRVEVFAIEGIGWAAPDLDERMADPEKRRHLLDLLQTLEQEETLFGATGHLLAVGWSTGG